MGGRLQVATSGQSVVGSGSGSFPCYFWISDQIGQDFEEFGDSFVQGSVFDLSEGPIEFNAKVPHCRQVDDVQRHKPEAPRISIAAFHLKRSFSPGPQ